MQIVRFKTGEIIKYGVLEGDIVRGFHGSPFQETSGQGSPFESDGISYTLKDVKPPFPRKSYEEVIEILQKKNFSIEWGEDIGGDEETALSESFNKPLFIYNYPKGVKAFYMKPNPDDTRTVLNNDLIAPEGFGEIIGGSQRNDDYHSLLGRIEEEGLNPEAYRWYLDIRKYGSVPHSGFGLGIERLLAWICKISHVREAIPFPRLINRLYP